MLFRQDGLCPVCVNDLEQEQTHRNQQRPESLYIIRPGNFYQKRSTVKLKE